MPASPLRNITLWNVGYISTACNMREYCVSQFWILLSFTYRQKLTLIFQWQSVKDPGKDFLYSIVVNYHTTIITLIQPIVLCSTRVFAIPSSGYRIWNNRQILTFKVSKPPYQSAKHDRMICKWCHYPPGGQKWNKRIISAIWRHILIFKMS